MPRPRTISDDTILKAARAVFMKDGPGASTASVAEAAGVSEGTIFKRFPTKESLLAAALGCPDALWQVRTAERVGRGAIATELAGLIVELIGFYRAMMPRMMMLISSGGLNPLAFWRGQEQVGPVAGLRRVTDYVDAEVRLGRLTTSAPEIVARTLMGACHNFAFFELAGIRLEGSCIDDETYAKGLVATLLSGVGGPPAAEQP